MEEKKVQSLDDIQTLGWYTAYICVLAEIMFLTQVGNVNYMVYAGLAPHNVDCDTLNNSTITIKNETICDFLSSSTVDSQTDNQSLFNCINNLTLIREPQFFSANIEFGYLCDDTKFIKRSISYQMIGIIVGSILFGQLSDSFGRKWPMIICLIGSAISDSVSSLATSLPTLTLFHGIALLFTGGQTAIIFVFLLENLPKKHRMWINAVISWSPNFALFAIIAYLSGNWRILARATSTITVPAILLSLFIYESPRWLIQKRRMNEASEVLKKIIMFNGDRHISNENISTVISNENASIAVSGRKENFYVYHLFCTKRLILYTFVFSFSYASTSIINYGIFFNMGKLPGSVYANNIFIGLTRWVINASVGFVDYKVKWFGRKMLHTLSLLSILLAVITVFMLTQFEMFEQYATLIRVSVLSISIMSSHLYIGNNVSTNELYPTPIRNVAFSFMQVVNRIGVAIAPQLFVLADFWTAAPYFAMFLLAGTDLLLCQLLIPESKGRTLEDSMPSSKRRLFSSKNAANKEDNFKYVSNKNDKYIVESNV